MCTIYTWDGNTDSVPGTRIGQYRGVPFGAAEINGVTYLIFWSYRFGNASFVLLAVSGAQLSVVDDQRFLLPDFQSDPVSFVEDSNGIPSARASVVGDGRFLYVSWPGYAGLRYDLVSSGVSKIGTQNGGALQTAVSAHRFEVNAGDPLVELTSYGTTVNLSYYRSAPTTGTYTSSYFDFDTPQVTKFFRSVEVDLAQPLATGDDVDMEYRIDNTQTWTAITNKQTLPNGNLLFLIGRIRGTRVQIRATLTAGAVIRAISVKGTLGRIWKTKLQCHWNQQLNDGETDGVTPQKLLGNIELVDANAGQCVAYVPSATDPSGVEMVLCDLETYNWVSVKPGPRLEADTPAGYEGVVEVTLKEALGDS